MRMLSDPVPVVPMSTWSRYEWPEGVKATFKDLIAQPPSPFSVCALPLLFQRQSFQAEINERTGDELKALLLGAATIGFVQTESDAKGSHFLVLTNNRTTIEWLRNELSLAVSNAFCIVPPSTTADTLVLSSGAQQQARACTIRIETVDNRRETTVTLRDPSSAIELLVVDLSGEAEASPEELTSVQQIVEEIQK